MSNKEKKLYVLFINHTKTPTDVKLNKLKAFLKVYQNKRFQYTEINSGFKVVDTRSGRMIVAHSTKNDNATIDPRTIGHLKMLFLGKGLGKS